MSLLSPEQPAHRVICFQRQTRFTTVHHSKLGDTTVAGTSQRPIPSEGFWDLQQWSAAEGSQEKISVLQADALFVASSKGRHTVFQSLGAEFRSLQAVSALGAPHVIDVSQLDSREQWYLSSGGYINAGLPYQALGLEIKDVHVVSKQDIRRLTCPVEVAGALPETESQAFDMEDQRCRDTLLHTGDMVCFDRGDGTVVSVSQAGASWQLEQYPIHGLCYPSSAVFLVHCIQGKITFHSVRAEGAMLQTNEDSAAEHLLGSISFDAASQWQACDTGFVNVAFPHKVLQWKIIELYAILEEDVDKLHYPLQPAQTTQHNRTEPLLSSVEDSAAQATAQMPPQDAAACQNVPGSSLESEEAKTEQLSTQPTSTAKSTELQTAGEYGLQDTAANHSERPSEQGLGSLERLADTQEHASVVVDTSAVLDGLLPADELTDVQACGQQDAGASMQDESVTLVQHSVDQARLQSALASTEQIPIYEDPEMTELKHCLGLPESLEHLAILPSRLATEVPIESCDCATLYSGAFRQLDDNSHILVILQVLDNNISLCFPELEHYLSLSTSRADASSCCIIGLSWMLQRPCIVMTTSSHTLSDEIKRMPGHQVSLQQTLQWGADIARELQVLYAAGLCAQTLKLTSILLWGQGQAPLLCGAFARKVQEAGVQHEDPIGVGSSLYKAPELVKLTDSMTAASDIWALGCILLEIYSGGIWLFAVVDTKLHRRPADDGLPEPFAALILRCLQPRPQGRPTAAEVLQVLDALTLQLNMTAK